MNRFAIRWMACLLAAWLCITVAVAQTPPSTTSPQPAFPRGVYWAHENFAPTADASGVGDRWAFADQLLERLARRHHVNTLWVTHAPLDDLAHLARLARPYAINVFAAVRGADRISSARSPRLLAQDAAQTVRALRDEPGIAGYVLRDEPPRRTLAGLEYVRRALAAVDPARPTVAVSRWGDLAVTARHTRLPILCVDVYPFFGPGSPSGPNNPGASKQFYWTVARELVRTSRLRGRTPWIMPQAFQEIWGGWRYDARGNVVADRGSYIHWRMPTDPEMRWQVWAGLQSGVRGIVFFQLFAVQHDRPSSADRDLAGNPTVDRDTPTDRALSLLHADGSSSAALDALGETYRFIADHEDILSRLEPLGYPLAEAEGGALRVGSFVDARTLEPVVIVVNDDLKQSTTAALRVLPSMASARVLGPGEGPGVGSGVDRVVSLPEPPDPQDGFIPLELTIEPGGGRLLRLNRWQRMADNAVLDLTFGLRGQPRGVSLDGLENTLADQSWTIRMAPVLSLKKAGEPGTLSLDLRRLLGKKPSVKHLYLRADFIGRTKASLRIDGEEPGAPTDLHGGELAPIPKRARTLQLTLSKGKLERVRLIGVW